MATSLFFDIFGRDKGVGKMLDDVASKAEGAGSKIAGGLQKAGPAAAGVLAGLGGVAIGFGQMAADAEQNAGAVKSVFGDAASQVEEFASRSAGAVGMSSSEYNKLSAVTGSALSAAGVSVDQLAGKNDELITRGADLASVFGGSTADAVGAMGAAFRGEFDSLEQYGVNLSAAKVEAELAARGQDDLGGAAGEAAKKQAIMDLIMQDSAKHTGQYAAEADTATGAQDRAGASFEDAGAKLGEVLLPAMTFVAEEAAKMATWAKDNSGLVTALAGVLGGLAGAVMAVRTAITLWTGVQWLLNAAMAANPIGIVIVGVGLLIGAFVLAYKNVGWFRDGVDAAFSGIKTAIGAVVDWFTGTVGPAFDTALKGIKGFFGDTVKNVGRIWDGLMDVAKKPISFIINTVINDGLIGAFNTVAGWIPGVNKLSPVRIPGFEDGGYTGDGPKREPKGVVHGGEFVFTKEETAKAGVSTFQRLSRVLRGFAEGGFVNPAPGATVSQGYHSGHNGIDLAAALGTPIRAAFHGRVASAGWSPHGGGNELHIEHAGGWETWYAHLQNMLVKAGQVVNRGMQIGLMGSTGNSTGSHLHYMVLRGGWPNHINPTPFLGGGGDIPAGGTPPFNPIEAIIGGLIGSIRGAFSAGGILTDIVVGIGQKIAGDMGKAIMGGGTGSTRGGFGLDVFDSGGWLDTVAINRSGKPEAVLTGAQWDTMRANANRPIVVHATIQNPWTGEEVVAVVRGVASEEADKAIGAANDDIYRGRAR